VSGKRIPSEALAALSGVLLFLSFPKFGHPAVAWTALAPLLVALAREQGRKATRLAYITGVVSSLGLLYWTSLVVVQYGGLALPVGIGVMVLLCLAFSGFTALFGWMMGRWIAAAGTAALLLAPAAWVAVEILRAHTVYRFSWCLLGYTQAANLPFIQIASTTAVYGVSFLVASSSAVLAYVAVEKQAARRARALAGLAALLAAVGIHGAWALGSLPPESGRMRVGLVQGNVPQDEKWDTGGALEHVARHARLTRQAAEQGARLVVWPESALPFYFDWTPEVASGLRELARETGVYLLFGNDDYEGGSGEDRRVFVGAKMLTPAGELALRYRKMRLVPFGEYVPMRPVLTLGGRFAAKLVKEVADFTPGSSYAVGEADGHGVAAFICYEAIFPDLVREFAAHGAGLLVNVTNDAWYGWTSAPYQHFAMARFRAVETGRYLVRAANTGITAVVDPRGRVLARTDLFEAAVVVRDVPVVRESTFYTRHGDVFAWACLGAAVAFTAATFRRR
jgi:apolipoprotein N-acyltransferase